MIKLSREDYIRKIKKATPLQLIIITYELIIVNLKEAHSSEDKQNFENHIKKAKDFIMQLMTSLDMNYPISNNLLDIYLYVNKTLSDVFFSKKYENVLECIDIMESLLDSFELIKDRDSLLEKMTKISPKMYSNLKYKDEELEDLVFENLKGGFQV